MLQQFLSFDKLIGTKLIKGLYFLGIAVILLAALKGLLEAIGKMGSSFGSGLGAFIATLLGALVLLVFWRFICEIYLLFFRMSDDLRDIKNHQLGRDANNIDVNIGDE